MKKRFTMLLTSLFLVMGTGVAQTAEVQGSTTVEKPEHQYVMKSGNNYWMAANTAPTKHALGRFAFFEVTETDNDANDYKIYSIDLKKWVSYDKAGSYSNGKDFAKLVDNQGDAQPWNVVKQTVSNVDYYQIAPYNNTGVAAKYMNWHGGINSTGYSYDDTRTVGLWQNGASDDAGSRWTLAECSDLGSIADGGDVATTWTPSSWWTTADNGGSNVLDAVKAVETAQYPDGNSNVMMRYMHMQVSAGRLDVTLNYEGGANRLDIVGVDLLNANGEVVVSDYHFGYTGNAKSLNTYTLPVETAGSYSLRYWVTFKSQPNNSNGNIAIAHTSVAELKEAAKAELEDLAKLSFMTVGDAVAQVDAVADNPNAAINAILVNVKKSADDKNLTFKNHGSDGRDGRYLGYDQANKRAAAVDPTSKEVIWTIKVQENGSFKLYNYIYDVYLGVPADPTPVISTEADAPAFDFIVKENNKVALVTGGKMAHVANHTNYKLIQYYDLNDGASLWTITQSDDIAVTRELYNQAVAAKAALPYAIQQAYGLVKDASKYSSNAPETAPAEGSSFDNLLDNNYSSYFHSAWSYGVDGNHYLQAEVSEEVKDFCFYFKKRHNTNNNRPTEIDILGSTDGEEFTLITTINNGLPTNENEIDYFSAKITAENNVKHLRFVVNNTNTPDSKEENDNPFFHFSEFYIFPAMSDVTNLIESYKNFATISITDDAIVDAANKLINAETTLALANIKKEANAILTANADKHEETPALGKYPSATYEALQNACDNGTTEVEIRTAIDNFKASKNLPVFTIDGVIDYARGKSIYDNPGSTNGKGNTHYFKTTNEFDKSMWWALDLTASDLTDNKINGPKSSVGIYNVGTGVGFWGASTIDITETSEDDATDDIFLFYANGGDPIHAQKDGALITKWESKGKDSGSAWKFSYIGSTFELSKYDDAYVAAYEALKTAYTPKSYMLTLFGEGIGQYSGDATTFLAPLTHATDLLMVPLKVLLQNYDTQDIVDATAAVNAMQEADILTNDNFTLNLPQDGKYYRIKGANADAENYVTGNVRAAGDRIALQAAANDATVFQYLTKDNGDGILLAVESNLYLALNSWTFKLKKADAAKTEFAASTRKVGAYTIKSGGSFFHYDNGFLNRCGSDGGHTAHDWYLEEVAEDDVPENTNLLTDINNLSAEASYRIYGDRGFIYVADDGNMKGTNAASANVEYNPNNDKHHFAIVTIDENKYLYNVGAKKFVMKSGNGVTLTDWPEQAITIEGKTDADSNVGYDWVIKLGDNRLNLSTGSGHTYGVLTNYETEDAGNVWAIYKVGTFDPAEAESMRKVVINYTIDGVAATETVGVAAGGTLNFSYDFATVTSCTVGEEAQTVTDGACSVTIQDNVTISVAMTSDNRLFRLKNTASSKYMTIVTSEAAEGVQIKDKADNPVKQAFRIVLANWQGKYNIKSTENYFMASSGAWNYGAYETANENGRAHELEALGEGKYGLKTLNGYAGPNSGATADGSPLYSNHGAGNSGREWELEELPKSSITYIYKWNDQTIVSEEHENVYEGFAAPATAVTLPFGFSYDAASLPTTKGAGNQEVVIACTLSLPFQFADSYDAIETNGYWYYLKFDSGNNYYLYHTDGQDYIALDSKVVDKKNKDVYSWGFVGDPINGFKIVNKAAGSTKILSSSTTMAGETGAETWPIMTVAEGLAEGNNTYWIPTASTHATNGFFLAQKDHPTHRMNNRGSKLAYWNGGADAGSTFVVVEQYEMTQSYSGIGSWEQSPVYPEGLKTGAASGSHGSAADHVGATGHSVYKYTKAIITTEADVTVSFNYVDSNSHGLIILGVDVVNGNGDVVASDYHVGFTGSAQDNRVYTLRNFPAGNYILRCYVCNKDDGTDHHLGSTGGNIVVNFAKELTDVDAVSTMWETLNKTGQSVLAYKGEGLGYYNNTEDVEVKIAVEPEKTVSGYTAAFVALDDAIDNAYFALPEAGKFYRIKSKVASRYVTAPANTGVQMIMSTETSVNNILYLDSEKHLLVYGTGYYINGKNHAILGYKDTYTFEASKNGVKGALAIKPGTQNYWYDNTEKLDAYQNGTHANCDWIVEEVRTLPVTVTAVGYATFYAPVEVTVPDGIAAYAIEEGKITQDNGDGTVKLSDPITVIPANTGVILYANGGGDFGLEITDTKAQALEGNLLSGASAKTLVKGDAYVLANDDRGIGLYLVALTRNKSGATGDTHFLNGANKAYLPKSAIITSNVRSLIFRFGDTGVEDMQAVPQHTLIYDLMGRPVERMEKGIYIVNGRKVVK